MSESPSAETRRVTVTVRHTLSARFVEIDEAQVEVFDREGVRVNVDARVRETQSFASVTCTGSSDIDSATDEIPGPGEYLPFVSAEGGLNEYQREVSRAWIRIEPALQDFGKALRWRFGMFGDDPLWTSTNITVEADGRHIELVPVVEAVMGDNMAKVAPGGLRDVAEMVTHSTTQPLAHELWREAWNLQHSSPRSSLVVGVASAEVGFKELVALLVPEAQSLVEYIPSPPLDTMIRKVLPDLPIRSGLDSTHGCPKHLRKQLIEAVEARNLVVHQGAIPALYLRSTLLDIRDFLYLLDVHAGHAWAEALLSKRTAEALRAT